MLQYFQLYLTIKLSFIESYHNFVENVFQVVCCIFVVWGKGVLSSEINWKRRYMKLIHCWSLGIDSNVRLKLITICAKTSPMNLPAKDKWFNVNEFFRSILCRRQYLNHSHKQKQQTWNRRLWNHKGINIETLYKWKFMYYYGIYL